VALDERLRVTFTTVAVREEPRLWGPGEWSFRASVDGTAVGDPTARFPVATRRDTIALPAAAWTLELDVGARDRIDVEFGGTARRADGDVDLGTVRWQMRFPFSQDDRTLSNRHFAVIVRVELMIAGAYGPHARTDVFACREVAGRPICTTVSGRRFTPRIEFCEVLPLPPDSALPPRPAQPAGTPAGVRNRGGHRNISPTDPINLVRNPAAIPVLAAADADLNTAACIEHTFYRPRTMNLTVDDDRLEWSVRSIAGGGAADFVGDPLGTRIHVYGTHEGEIALECRMDGALVATYRALVLPLRDITCRFNILNGPGASQPRSGPTDIEEQLAIANIILRQACVQLVLDTDPTPTDGAVATGVAGIFRIPVSPGTTRNIAVADFPRATRLNYRAGVMNFAYIHSDAGIPALGLGPFLGMATDLGGSTGGTTIRDNGTPSSSWKKPSGIHPDKAANERTMRLFAAKHRTGHPQLFAMYVTNGNGNPARAADRFTYAGTIAHELGHVLGLRHRVGPGHDGVLHPWSENLMHHNNATTLAQDIDILQARAIQTSPVVR
jgi:hypothetical protein